ncbi:F-box protein At4g22280-like [Miscanthus floridulus]|uniref:F-box protein At4g22280-like n=1 Tax=Miscanthus floridulus TaxID=154761 RepID=UPI00345A33FA
MDSGSTTVLAGGGRDRLSSLGDATLCHILSSLPATEAARTATLSRRWRHAAVHTLSFGEAEAPRFLRALRVALDESGFRGGDDATKAVDGWLSYAVHQPVRLADSYRCCDVREEEGDYRHDATNMDMRYEMAEGQDDEDYDATDDSAAASDDDEESDPVVEETRSTCCCIDLPSAIALPSLDTLHLTRVTGRRGGASAIQQLVSACPSLVDLTLGACVNLTTLEAYGAATSWAPSSSARRSCGPSSSAAPSRRRRSLL